MGRFLRGLSGKVGLIAGSLALRDHIERQFGFEQVLTHEYPNLQVLPVRESRDDWRKLEEMTAQLLAEHPDQRRLLLDDPSLRAPTRSAPVLMPAHLDALAHTQQGVEFLIAKARFSDRLRGQLNDRQEKAIERIFRDPELARLAPVEIQRLTRDHVVGQTVVDAGHGAQHGKSRGWFNLFLEQGKQRSFILHFLPLYFLQRACGIKPYFRQHRQYAFL